MAETDDATVTPAMRPAFEFFAGENVGSGAEAVGIGSPELVEEVGLLIDVNRGSRGTTEQLTMDLPSLPLHRKHQEPQADQEGGMFQTSVPANWERTDQSPGSLQGPTVRSTSRHVSNAKCSTKFFHRKLPGL